MTSSITDFPILAFIVQIYPELAIFTSPVISNESLQNFVYILPVGQCIPDKNATYVSDVMPCQ